MASDYSNQNDRYAWIFFAGNAKPTSMRRALAERLAERESVVIVYQPVSFLRDKKLPGFAKRCERLSGGNGACYYRPIYFPARLPGVGKILKHLNQRLLERELNSLLPKNGKRIVCYDSPTHDQLIGKLGEDLRVYIAIDEKTLTMSGEPIQGEVEAEKRLLGRVDRVICVSEKLAEVLRSRVPCGRSLSIFVLPNGYDERIFDPGKSYLEPSDLAHVPKPRILVAGHISERIDWEGITGAVKARPNWTWVFIGPADAGMVERINTIGGSTLYHPTVPVEKVPAWIRYCNACAVPYRLNPFTMASSPLKAIEYLAMGSPVLSTRIPGLQAYGDVIHWVDESCGMSYARGLDKALEEKKDFGRMNARCMAVSNDSWARKAETFKAIVLNV
jgi:glycosyltransferase involved in cell wall biosynthesis